MALKTAQVVDKCLALKTLESGNRPWRFGVNVFLLTKNDLSNQLPAVNLVQRGRDDVEPVGFAAAFRTTLTVAADPKR